MKRRTIGLVVGTLLICTVLASAQGPYSAQIQSAIRALKAAANVWTGTNTFSGPISIGTTIPVGASTGSLALPDTTAAGVGIIYKGGLLFIHNYAEAGTHGLNTFVGAGAGNVTMSAGGGAIWLASYLTAIGEGAGASITTGYDNLFVGTRAGHDQTTGHHNTFLGVQAGQSTTTGTFNDFYGMQAGFTNTTGNYNVAAGGWTGFNLNSDWNTLLGMKAGFSLTTGDSNTLVGAQAGVSVEAGSRDVMIGFNAGFWETGSDTLMIDDRIRADEADARIKALVYGIFADAVVDQTFTVNAGHLKFPGLAQYANDVAAQAAGLVAGDCYVNSVSKAIVVVQ